MPSRIFTLLFTLLGVAVCAYSGTSQAALLRYDFSGSMSIGLQAQTTDDPLATLLGVATSGNFVLPYTVSVVVDSDSPPDVLLDTVQGQNYVYRNAIRHLRIDLNGAVFESTRRPDPLREIIVIDIFNQTLQTSNDQAQIGFQDQGGGLFGGRSVAVNETVNGVFVDDARIFVNSLNVFVLGRGLLDDAALPSSAADWSGAQVYGAGIQFGVDLSPSSAADAVNATHAFGSAYTFSVTPVPLPAAVWLMAPAVALLGMRSLRR